MESYWNKGKPAEGGKEKDAAVAANGVNGVIAMATRADIAPGKVAPMEEAETATGTV